MQSVGLLLFSVNEAARLGKKCKPANIVGKHSKDRRVVIQGDSVDSESVTSLEENGPGIHHADKI